ncbi:MAG: hypothetical protein H3C68_06020 [Deltaproteobacteria bacterium]|nr:hypothetical protein [Deltaproteobacteria bacterium]MBZ0220286.1 hypothetical protein [Deltaproteobacteria bacterium]
MQRKDILFCLFLVLILFGVSFLPYLQPGSTALFRENNLIESLSALGYGLAAAYAFFKGGVRFVRTRPYFIALFVFCALRELDFNRRFTSVGLMKLEFYTGHTPLAEKLLGSLVLMILAWIAVMILKQHLIRFRRGFAAHGRIYMLSIAGFLLAALVKTLDGFQRKLRSLGVYLPDAWSAYVTYLEESLELGIPLVILWTLVVYFRDYHNDEGTPGSAPRNGVIRS